MRLLDLSDSGAADLRAEICEQWCLQIGKGRQLSQSCRPLFCYGTRAVQHHETGTTGTMIFRVPGVKWSGCAPSPYKGGAL
jgi:hypothetical protein